MGVKGFFAVLGIIFLIIILVLVVGGFLAYNYYSISVASVCIHEYTTKAPVTCSSVDQCADFFYSNNINESNIPSELQGKIRVLVDEISSCNQEGLCEFSNFSLVKNKGVVKDQFGEGISLVESCDGREISIDLKAKEALTIVKNSRQ